MTTKVWVVQYHEERGEDDFDAQENGDFVELFKSQESAIACMELVKNKNFTVWMYEEEVKA